MKLLVIFALVAAAAARPSEDHYDEKYDNFDADEVINNDRLLKSFTLCFLGEGKCSPDGTYFKKLLPEAVQTECGKCTDKQNVLIAKVIKAMKEKFPELWEKLYKTHDPENAKLEALNAYIAKHAP